MPADLLVRNARLADREGLVDLAVEAGRFTRIGPELAVEATRTLDAEGRLASPPLVDCHLHLDSSLTAGKPRYNASGTLLEGIQVWGELKSSLTEEDVYARARQIVLWSAAQGTLFIRAHADVSGENDAMLRGLLRVRDELADLVTIQVTAFPQDGIFGRPGDEQRLEAASSRVSTASAASRITSRRASLGCARSTGSSSSRAPTTEGSTSTATRPMTRTPAFWR